MDLDTFTLLPIQVDPSTKAVSTTTPTSKNTPTDPSLQTELAALNTLHRSMVGLDTPNSVPPPPLPVNPKRSQQIQKLRESGNQSLKRTNNTEAIKLYSLGIEMALGRPSWEPQGLVREEVAGLYANRAQAYIAQNEWADGAVDAEASLEMKKPQNSKAWWRLGRCYLEMGRLEEARDVVGRGLEFEQGGHEPDLVRLRGQVDELLKQRRGG